MSQYGSTFEPCATIDAAMAMTTKPDPIKITPIAKVAGAEGLRWRGASAIQTQATSGANAMTKAGLSDWNQLAGMTKDPIARSVYRSANRLSNDPACS